MTFREITNSDIEQILVIRHSVHENKLADPASITAADCEAFLNAGGIGWGSEVDGQLVGFCMIDLANHNVWALFIRPEYEGRGIGKQLHRLMLDWYFSMTKETLWLGTDPRTRAEQFYRKLGWEAVGMRPNGEIKFEMSWEKWKAYC